MSDKMKDFFVGLLVYGCIALFFVGVFLAETNATNPSKTWQPSAFELLMYWQALGR